MTLLFAAVAACVGLVVVTEADEAFADQIAGLLARWPRTTPVFVVGWSFALAIHLLTEAPR